MAVTKRIWPPLTSLTCEREKLFTSDFANVTADLLLSCLLCGREASDIIMTSQPHHFTIKLQRA